MPDMIHHRENRLRQRVVRALAPVPATPRLTIACMSALRALDNSTEPTAMLGAEVKAHRIAHTVASHTTYSEALDIARENERFASMRVTMAGPELSVNDAARLTLTEILMRVILSEL